MPSTGMRAPASRRISITSPISPLTPSHIPRPHSAASIASHTRLHHQPDTFSASSTDPESRNVRVSASFHLLPGLLLIAVLRIKPSDPNDPSVPPRFRNTLVHPISPSDVRVDVDPATLSGLSAGTIGSGNKKHPIFTYDHVLGEQSSQVDLYDVTAKSVVDEFLKGHNVTFLAYGQTSSGKSYSMGTTGEDLDYSGIDFTPRTGLIPRTVQAIFEQAEQLRLASGPGASWECRISFLELYNEEIIDLLSGNGIQITIREERDGRIVWSGVREAKVKNLAEVMDLLQEGSTRRRTGETGMNATSSRSHAIFSLALVQKRRAKQVTPTSGVATEGDRPETPTRLKRPSSTIGMSSLRSTTPLGNRALPPTSFPSTRAGGSNRNSLQLVPNDDFLIVTSKFNMVDLAGSERLKRTAAQGERMKEGISINSGLLALGNVISTLADPVKSRGHVPYRDSKLTRLLQDSIGGNAITTMIACVSGIEHNVGETLNTMKYASRARNIKNSAKANAVEAGWEDVEYLQNTVLKLRKQLNEVGTGGQNPSSPVENFKQTEKVLQRLSELQKEHTEVRPDVLELAKRQLYDRYLSKCSENIRLTSELKTGKPEGDEEALARFTETVEPVILEYEKVVTSLNKQLDELRDELVLANELFLEQSQSLLDAKERQSRDESYTVELQTRLTKLSERNASSEAHIRDLEIQLKSHADEKNSTDDVAAGLRKEISNLKASHAEVAQHSSEIEARLATADQSISNLEAQVATHEKEVRRKDETYQDLEARIKLLDKTNDNKALLAELEARDARITELEKLQAETLESERSEKQRLTEELEAERAAQTELRIQLDASTSTFRPSPVLQVRGMTPPDSPEPDHSANSTPALAAAEAEAELAKLRAAFAELSKKCEAAESKNAESEQRIAELGTQLSEAKLIQSEMDDTLSQSPPTPSPERDGVFNAPPGPSQLKRRGGSLSLTLNTGFRAGRGYGESQRARPQSLSQELSSAQSSASSLNTSWSANSLLLGASPTRQSMPIQKRLRSQKSLEAELKFVHQVVEERDAELRDRETYIKHLEQTLQEQSHAILSRQPSAMSLHPSSAGVSPNAADVPLPITPETPLLTLPPVTPMKGQHLMASGSTAHLSPISTKHFNDLKDSLDRLEGQESNLQDSQKRVDDLMKEMAVKEASSRQILDQQFIQIADLQKQTYKLREALVAGNPGLAAALEELDALRKEHHELIAAQTVLPPSPSSLGDSAINSIREEHANEIQALIKSHAEAMSAVQLDNTQESSELRHTLELAREEHEAAISTLQFTRDATILDLVSSHKDALKRLQADSDALISEMEESLSASEEDRRQLKVRVDQLHFELSRTKDEHQIQRSADFKHLEELEQAKMELEKTIAELETIQHELSKRNSELENRFSRRPSGILPPLGPPPNVPLPPLPAGIIRTPGSGGKSLSSVSGESGASLYSSGSKHTVHRRSDESVAASAGDGLSVGHGRMKSIDEDLQRVISEMPQHLVGRVKKVVDERDEAIEERDSLREQLSSGSKIASELEERLHEQVTKADALVREVADSKKTSESHRSLLEASRAINEASILTLSDSKLRAHLEDSRQENKRQTEACKFHMDELTDRRDKMAQQDEARRQDRDSLTAANAQVVSLKQQLERAMDTKVNKKMNSRLKCF